MASVKLSGDTKLARLIASGGLLSYLLTGPAVPLTWANSLALAPGSSTSTQSKSDANKDAFKGEGSGTLLAMATTGKPLGQCPLKHTSVTAKVSGYVSHVTVKQTFHNPFKDKIEAVYTFPLSETGAVDEMIMKVGARTIHGTIKKREEAKQIYEDAKAHGRVASLLDQERPNIFTQSVANIEPGKEVEITIQYVDLLPYEDGKYSFAFPTVVGPRFNPGPPIGRTGTGRSPDTTEVPDASRITPPVTPAGTRTGHDISITVDIDGGVPISNVRSSLHEVAVANHGNSAASVSLVDKSTIPNKDFVLKWDVAGDSLKSGYLTYRDPKTKDASGYFTMMLLPPKRVTPETVAPKEMIFLIDCSGSQSGKPLDKAKETLTYIVDHMNPNDSFQIISFNNTNSALFKAPTQNSDAMRKEAKQYITELKAQGGTWMGPAVEAVFNQPTDKNRLRIVTFMTDGYVGNDMEILGLVKKHRGASRWFPFGTGNSVNRFLIDGIAREGGGESEFVLLNSAPGEVGKKFYERISSPVLTDVKVSFDGGDVKEVFPKDVSDVWAQKPLYIKGRYTTPGAATATLTGFHAGKPYKQTLKMTLPDNSATNAGVASIWARAKVDRLMSEDWFGAQSGSPNKEIKDEIVKTALAHHIMTQYTSFVAVEEKYVTKGGKPVLEVVPVEMPDGVSRKGVFGENDENAGSLQPGRAAPMMAVPSGGNWGRSKGMRVAADRAYGGGYGVGYGSAVRGGLMGNQAAASGMIRQQRAESLKSSGILANESSLSALPEPASEMAKKIAKPNIQQYTPVHKEEQKADKDQNKNHQADDDAAKSKLDPRLHNLETALKLKGSIVGLTIVDGKVSIRVTVTTEGKAVMALLKKAGLEGLSSVTVQGNKFTVTGKIAVKKLNALAQLAQVVYISPAH
ncbi:MAG: VIT and VWA domain-containing protein [Candidatus Melainabacteria bacterium]|nr:VIT and VWA domain-containing protein [Candidatus Melainabacteria bacterium]